jgi:NAD(P)-dependent dehydrogenase (short-subunit alcohol dehydrogenase family)
MIVVAGGGSGLGAATVELLLAEGAEVVVSYKLRRERVAPFEGRAKLVQADLTRAEERARLLDAAPGLYGLAVFTGDPARARSAAELEQAMAHSQAVNYVGPAMLAREAAERMRAAGTHGAIVLLSTMQAVAVFPGSTAYAGAKVALLQAAKILAKECRGGTDIRVNVICPGVNAAGMAEASIASGKYESYITNGVIPRYGRPEDVARAARLFLEPDGYITGQVLTVDGGLTL